MAAQRRSRKFINRPLQIKIAVEVVLHAILLVALISLILFAEPFVEWFSEYSAADHVAVARELVELNRAKWPLFAGLAVFIGVVSILFSHHIAGPMFHLQRVFSDLNERKLDARVRFRRWDYLNELQDDFNGAIDKWKGDVEAISKAQQEALKYAREIHEGTASEDKILELEKRLQVIEKTVQGYEGIA